MKDFAKVDGLVVPGGFGVRGAEGRFGGDLCAGA